MQPENNDRDYDAEVANMLRLATAIHDAQPIQRLTDQTSGVSGLPGVMIVATTGGEDQDADA